MDGASNGRSIADRGFLRTVAPIDAAVPRGLQKMREWTQVRPVRQRVFVRGLAQVLSAVSRYGVIAGCDLVYNKKLEYLYPARFDRPDIPGFAISVKAGGSASWTCDMELSALELPGAFLLRPKRWHDARGYFVEQHNKKTLARLGLDFDFVQDNLSYSATSGVVRGLHFQPPPSAQTKLVSVVRGAALDVLVDIRAGSPTYGRHVAINLSEDNATQILVPRGFAHGFCTLADDTVVQYKVDAHYDPERDFGLSWNDPALQINWPVDERMAILSEKDRKFPRLADLPRYFEWTGH